jgi:transposase
MLARFGATIQPDIRPARDTAIDALAELQVARRALVKDRIAALNRGKNLTLPLLTRQNQQQLKQIEAQIEAIDREQAALVARQERLKTRFDILISIPGIGAVSALAMLIDMPELGSIENKQAASLSGLAPITRQSGNWRGKSVIQGGRAPLRQALYMPALVAIRFNPPLKAKYLALRKAGKPAKVAIVAVMRKLIVLANALLRDQRKWTPEPISA